MESLILGLNNLLGNKGQIEGVPKNPRTIKDDKYVRLKQSITEDPDFMQYRPLLVVPHKNKFIVIGGNMRREALIELGYTHAPCVVIPANTEPEKIRRFLLKDNGSFGEWNHEELSSLFSEGEIIAAGIDIPVPYEPETLPEDPDPISDISTKLTVEAGTPDKLRELFLELQQRGFICVLK